MKVLLVEDDPGIVEIVRLGLSYEGAEVEVATDGLSAIEAHRRFLPDVVVLDVMLPRLDGLGVLERIRAQRDTPVILLTARDALEDRVAGLDAGADDYVTKPFQFPELVARIRAVLRRRGQAEDGDVLRVADLVIDRAAHEVRRAGRRIELTAKQFEVLDLLAANARRVLSKEQIFEAVWGWEYDHNPNVVEQHISHLRDKIDRGFEPKLIHTIRNVGYVLRDGG
jgi:two-component system OmpR family response regulator